MDLRPYDEPGSRWSYSPLFEELVHLPLVIRAPGVSPGVRNGLSSAIDVMPTVLDMLGVAIPDFVQGRSLAPALDDAEQSGRDYVISSIHSPIRATRFNPSITSFVISKTSGHDGHRGTLEPAYSPDPGVSQLYNLASDPRQLDNVIESHLDLARRCIGCWWRYA